MSATTREEVQQDMKETVERALDTEKRSCTSCGHSDVCVVLRAVTPLMAQKFTDKTRPFNPEDIGQICKTWLPRSLVKAINGGER